MCFMGGHVLVLIPAFRFCSHTPSVRSYNVQSILEMDQPNRVHTKLHGTYPI